MTKKLTRFIDAYDNKHLYLDLNQIVALKDLTANRNSHLSGTLAAAPDYGNAQTQIYIKDSQMAFTVQEHITIVTALIQGIDPTPAQIIFGKE